MSGTISPVSAPGISVVPARPQQPAPLTPLHATAVHSGLRTDIGRPVAAVTPVQTVAAPVSYPAVPAPVPAPEPSYQEQTPYEAPSTAGHRLLRAGLVTVCLVGFVAAALQLSLQGLYGGRFLPGVTVAGEDVGGMTRPEVKELIKTRIERYRVRFSVGSKQYTLTPAQVGARYDLNATLDQAYLTGREQQFLPLAIWRIRHSASVALAYSVDQAAEKAFVTKVVETTGQAPVDASIVINKGVPEVRPDKNGQALSPKQVEDAIDRQISQISLDAPVLQPEVQQADIQAADVAPALEKTKKLLTVSVTLTYKGKSYSPSATQMGEWITYDKADGQLVPKANNDGIMHYLATLDNDITVAPVARKVTVENGVSKETQPGKDGIALDQDAMAKVIATSLMAAKSLTTEAITKPVPFKTVYNNVISLDIGRYVEVNLNTQHLYVWQDHQIIFDSPVTSGATGAGFETAKGLFAIYSKQTNRHLVGYQYGYNYDVFVHYWMPFYQGYGLHDASWRHGVFGGPDYYWNGSHGCVNLPDATAAFLYDWATVGTPVWVHR